MTEAEFREQRTKFWWLDGKNQTTVELPIACIEKNGVFIVTTTEETKKYIGDYIHGDGFGTTREEAIDMMFEGMRAVIDFDRRCRLSYMRFVPFLKGDLQSIGGTWFTIFGLQFYFRYGKGMKKGFYLPFTKLNIRFTNYWRVYKRTYGKKRD
ncbi:MAG TPA: hypothetical protein PK289_12130 [Bacteroidia bacterium]|nr:hypothetical protein [Bacteroidia bacterium]